MSPSGVGRTEVVQLDAVEVLEQPEALGEGGRGQPGGAAGEQVHATHVGAGVLVRDDLDHVRELAVAAGVIEIGVRVDDGGDRQVRDLVDRIEDRLPPPRQLGADQDDPAVDLVDQRERVRAAVSQVVERVADVESVDADEPLFLFLAAPGSGGERQQENGAQHDRPRPPLHGIPPRMPVRSESASTTDWNIIPPAGRFDPLHPTRIQCGGASRRWRRRTLVSSRPGRRARGGAGHSPCPAGRTRGSRAVRASQPVGGLHHRSRVVSTGSDAL